MSFPTLGFLNLGPMEVIIAVPLALVFVVSWWKIFAKAGFPGALSLLMLVPLVNFVMFLVVAFAPWPALKEKKED